MFWPSATHSWSVLWNPIDLNNIQHMPDILSTSNFLNISFANRALLLGFYFRFVDTIGLIFKNRNFNVYSSYKTRKWTTDQLQYGLFYKFLQVYLMFLLFTCCIQVFPICRQMFTTVYKIREPNTDPRSFWDKIADWVRIRLFRGHLLEVHLARFKWSIRGLIRERA